MAIPTGPGFMWDDASNPTGNTAHIAQHGVTRAEAESALRDPAIIFRALVVVAGEWRAEFVGRTDTGRIITVVVTPRGEQLRVITAYPARPRHRREYLARR